MNGSTQEQTSSAQADVPGRVGPNAVLQLVEALNAESSPSETAEVFADAGLSHLLDKPPDSMTDERIPRRLFDAVWRRMPREKAGPIARDAGRKTADYIIANRIPRFAGFLLGALPPWIASRLLLAAIEKHAWTFAGSGKCQTCWRPVSTISISANPLAMPDCQWHTAVFERLFTRLVCAQATVRHTHCCLSGEDACRFEITVPWPRTLLALRRRLDGFAINHFRLRLR
ncbi:MAG: bacteriochlorophyll 4-vinyl reductase [Pseudomonadota bacterium]